jgi:hypothetical protein
VFVFQNSGKNAIEVAMRLEIRAHIVTISVIIMIIIVHGKLKFYRQKNNLYVFIVL